MYNLAAMKEQAVYDAYFWSDARRLESDDARDAYQDNRGRTGSPRMAMFVASLVPRILTSAFSAPLVVPMCYQVSLTISPYFRIRSL